MKLNKYNKDAINYVMKELGFEKFKKISDIEKYLNENNKTYENFKSEMRYNLKAQNETKRNIDTIKKEIKKKNKDLDYIAQLDYKINEGIKYLMGETTKSEYSDNMADASFSNTVTDDSIEILKSYYKGRTEKKFEKLKNEHGGMEIPTSKYLQLFYSANVIATYKNGEKVFCTLGDCLKNVDEKTMWKFIEKARELLNISWKETAYKEMSDIVEAFSKNNAVFTEFQRFLKDDIIALA